MLTWLTENLVNVLTLYKNIFSRSTSVLFECSDRFNYYIYICHNQSELNPQIITALLEEHLVIC